MQTAQRPEEEPRNVTRGHVTAGGSGARRPDRR
jgi:hypothetical protein